MRKQIKHIAVIGIKGLPSKGGGERVAEAIILAAIRANYKVTVYAKRSYSPRTDLPKNINIILIPDIKGKHASAVSYGLLAALHALLFGNYHLIHLHYADFGFIVPLLRLRYKIIGTSHGAEYNRDKWGILAKLSFRVFEILFCRYVNICTSVSNTLASQYRSKYKKEIIFIPNGIYLQQSQEDCGKGLQKFNVKKNEYILFVAGRIIPTKGLEFLLSANKLLNLDIPIVIAGKLEENKKYLQTLKDLHEKNVQYIGFLSSKEDLFNLIQGCKFFVFPSTYEAMSIALLEVASLGKGIICSDIQENIDAIKNNAVFFRSSDINDLSEKISYAINNPDKINLYGVMAMEWVNQNRNWDVIAKEYFSLYESLLHTTNIN